MVKTSSIDRKRNIGLDWLRGLCAISILLYHYFRGSDVFFILNKLGVYGVAIFFVLSGLSMAIVYNNKMKSFKNAVNYFLKRIFRIAPLYTLISILTAAIIFYTTSVFDFKTFLLNTSLLFGYIDHTSYIPRGGWSIGNEMVYYLITPIVFIIYTKNKHFGNLIFILTLAVGAVFSYHLLTPDVPLSGQWVLYSNPFNNMFLYIGGIAIYYNLSKIKLSNKVLIIILACCSLIFILLPYGSGINITTGSLRFAYVLTCISIVFCFYRLQITKMNWIGRLFEKFGIATYGVYLFHPVILSILAMFLDINLYTKVFAGIVTIIISIFSYYYFELKVSNFGKKLLKNN